MLNEQELASYVDRHMGRSVFRLEVRDRYVVDTDADNVRRYLAGEPAPSMRVKGPWLERLRRERTQGIVRSRVHVVAGPLADYLRYECEWGYWYTVDAGEDVRILDLTERAKPDGLLDFDFLLLDEQYPIAVHYDCDDRFVGAEPIPSRLDEIRACRDAVMGVAVPFTEYWLAHPQYWRINQSRYE